MKITIYGDNGREIDLFEMDNDIDIVIKDARGGISCTVDRVELVRALIALGEKEVE